MNCDFKMPHWMRPSVLSTAFLYPLLVCAGEKLNSRGLHSFVTRPDLQPPKWNISVHGEEALSPGYWFIAPYDVWSRSDRSRAWTGPHIYDNRGELIWSGAHSFNRTDQEFDFRLLSFENEEYLTFARPDGRDLIRLNRQLEMVGGHVKDEVHAEATHLVNDGKDTFHINGEVRDAPDEDTWAVGIKDRTCKAYFPGFGVTDLQTGASTFTWTSFDHVSIEESRFLSAEEQCSNPGGWDFLQINAVSKCPDGDFLVSGYHTDTVYKISHENGSVVWRLGGIWNNFAREDLQFSRQSQVECREQNGTHIIISLLDNAQGGGAALPSGQYSRVLVVLLDTEEMLATFLAEYPHPIGQGSYSSPRTSYQTLPNENTWITWTDEQALITEYAPDGTLVLQAQLESDWLKSYKAYKFELPPGGLQANSSPDVFAQSYVSPDNSTSMVVYVSWHGVTGIEKWNVYSTDHKGNTVHTLLSKPKRGFETVFRYEGGFARYVVVEAFDVHGNSLGKSGVVMTLPPSDLLTSQRTSLKLGGALPYFDDNGKGDMSAFVKGVSVSTVVAVGIFFFMWAVARRKGVNLLEVLLSGDNGESVVGRGEYVPLKDVERKIAGRRKRVRFEDEGWVDA